MTTEAKTGASSPGTDACAAPTSPVVESAARSEVLAAKGKSADSQGLSGLPAVRSHTSKTSVLFTRASESTIATTVGTASTAPVAGRSAGQRPSRGRKRRSGLDRYQLSVRLATALLSTILLITIVVPLATFKKGTQPTSDAGSAVSAAKTQSSVREPNVTSSPVELRSAGTVIKPAYDNRTYLPVQLPNGLLVTLVQNPDAKAAHAFMTIRAGSQDDPIKLPGIAFLCAQMVLMGSKRYPGKHDFYNFLHANGGFNSSSVFPPFTSIGLKVSPKRLKTAVDMLLEGLASPTFAFDRDDVIKAAYRWYSYLEHYPNVFRSQYQEMIMGAVANKLHPLHQRLLPPPSPLNTSEVMQQIRAFHRKHYTIDKVS